MRTGEGERAKAAGACIFDTLFCSHFTFDRTLHPVCLNIWHYSAIAHLPRTVRLIVIIILRQLWALLKFLNCKIIAVRPKRVTTVLFSAVKRLT
jgi:hypothetical protein